MKLLDAFKSAALLSLVVLLWAGSYLLWTTAMVESKTGDNVASVLNHADSVLTHANDVLVRTGSAVSGVQESVAQIQKSVSGLSSSANQTLQMVNRPCSPGPCGTVADINKTLGTVRGTVGIFENAAHHWDRNLTNLDDQETQLFEHTDAAILGVTKTTNDLNSLLSDPKTTQTLSNFQTITSNLGQTTGDFQHKFHDFLYPPPCSGFRCRVSKTFTYIKMGSSLAEPAYWGTQLIKAIP